MHTLETRMTNSEQTRGNDRHARGVRFPAPGTRQQDEANHQQCNRRRRAPCDINEHSGEEYRGRIRHTAVFTLVETEQDANDTADDEYQTGEVEL